MVWDYFQAWDTTTQHELYTAYVEGTTIQPAQKLTTCGTNECSAHAAIDGERQRHCRVESARYGRKK
jgi:hypothetical protein